MAKWLKKWLRETFIPSEIEKRMKRIMKTIGGEEEGEEERIVRKAKIINYEPEGMEGTESFRKWWEGFKKKPRVILIVGARGSGKTALGLKILEEMAYPDRQCYVVGEQFKKVLPRWIGILKGVNINELKDCIVMIDEAELYKTSKQKERKELAEILALSRQKKLTIIWIVQNTSLIDRHVLRFVDAIFFKKMGLLQERFERSELMDMFQEVKNKVESVEDCYIISEYFEGKIKNKLPKFWNEEISYAFS